MSNLAFEMAAQSLLAYDIAYNSTSRAPDLGKLTSLASPFFAITRLRHLVLTRNRSFWLRGSVHAQLLC
jgi:hypothetical protein